MASKLKLRKKKYHPPIAARNDDNTTRQDSNSNTNLKIVERAIASAQKHRIKLKPGRANHGDGNCSFEATIFNINDRSCFQEKLPMTPDFYRRIWITDMMNTILDKNKSLESRPDKNRNCRGFPRIDDIWSI